MEGLGSGDFCGSHKCMRLLSSFTVSYFVKLLFSKQYIYFQCNIIYLHNCYSEKRYFIVFYVTEKLSCTLVQWCVEFHVKDVNSKDVISSESKDYFSESFRKMLEIFKFFLFACFCFLVWASCPPSGKNAVGLFFSKTK